MANDKYGIPQPGGNNGPYAAHTWGGTSYTLPWTELMACIAMGGWPQDKWGMAGAICAAESGRNPFIYNTYKQGHFGAFQISRSAWPDFFAPNGEGMQWCAPWANAKQAYAVYKQQGWGAWEGKTNGSYLAYYPAAMNAAADLQRKTGLHGGDEKAYWNSLISQKTFGLVLHAMGVTGADIAGVATSGLGGAIAGAADATAQGTVNAGGDVASSVNANFGWLPDLYKSLTTPAIWMRFAYGLTGVALVAGGLFLIVSHRPAVQKTAKAAMTVIPGGAAAKAATAAKGAA